MRSNNSSSHRLAILGLTVALSVAACGGGGGDSSSNVESTATANEDAVLATAQALSERDQPQDGDALRAQAAASTSDSGSPAATASPPIVQLQALAVAKLAVASRVFYVSSALGSDTAAGTSAGTAWKTLAKVASLALQPGDQIRLTCGSNWQETLKISASGTETSPISVVGYPEGCATPPVIDGGQPLAASAWTRHNGNIYRAALTTEPNQVLTSGGVMTLAHHPNRGHDSTQPTSLYLRNAADSAATTLNGRSVSTYLTLGSDLKLPAGAVITPSTAVRIRTNAWTIDDSTVASVSGSRVNLTAATRYPIQQGWGYFLLGQLWMLDSPGEWYYDKTAKVLYAWLPSSATPGSNVIPSILAKAVDISGTKYVQVSGLKLKRVGVAVYGRSTTKAVIRSNTIEDVAGIGVDIAGATYGTVESNTISRTGDDAVSAVVPGAGLGSYNTFLSNQINQSGVLFEGSAVASVPRSAVAGIRSGVSSTVANNTITDAAYNGILPSASSDVRNNVVRGACAILDDCGGIYTTGAKHNSTITGNIVLNIRSALEGKAPANAYPQSQGIFIDESSSGIKITGNTITGADNGIHIHVSSNNTIDGNTLYGNRKAQLWLQETRNADASTGDVFGNVITANVIVPTAASALGVKQQTSILSTELFGRFDRNRYFDFFYPTVVTERGPTFANDWTLSQWQQAKTAAGASRAQDANATGLAGKGYALYRVTGNSLVPNGDLATSAKGWAIWSAMAPMGTLTRFAGTPGWSLRYTAGAAAGLLSSPNFSIVGGQWYRLSLDVRTAVVGQRVPITVRRGGGGANGYEPLTNVTLSATGSASWTRTTYIFKATATVNANDPATGDKGARVDFDGLQAGTALEIANVALVAITSPDDAARADLIVNTTATAAWFACPSASSNASMCPNFRRMSNGAPVAWPLSMAAYGSEVVYSIAPELADSDGDGIPDTQDACPATPAGQTVNARGCALGETS
jgi:parallel beta-helix repeat protein